jgi:hypothetical protein
MIMFSNGNSFGRDGGNSLNGDVMHGDPRNTEPAYVRWLAAIQPGAVS